MKHSAIITLFLLILLGCERSELPPDSAEAPDEVTGAERGTSMPHPELEFFNSLSGQLDIELTVAAEKVGGLQNLRATPEAKIKTLQFLAEVYNSDTETFRELTPDELKSVAFRAPQITLRGEGGGTVSHQAPNGEYFTTEELLNAVAETERQSRGNSEWIGGVDVHHIFFEGIYPAEDDVWEIYWGS